ncbi:NUDIX domain-containing protein [Aquitalea sp. S1-19]|uniref:NUDIX domain-containing protein n=1 Tax=Craterilacuibacter sinensis TaxID=2686017 RepID=A0A845BI18_9NEIS|nr:NUDIX domain-containing protein [Craterilacuibacter sinensis]MCP9759583.1 NUDIX domain-containing protein [Aquitalea sp. S1-19]MXR35792.1 NUDIX domain-containing protein [Craterilacuibacter sinensis]RQW29581.1 NUDIX domain-containing protein [Rhodobacteraceae bacterium CH30]
MQIPREVRLERPLSPDLVRRATAIVELPDGVLVTAVLGGRYCLPGGRAERGELRSQALLRQLREETGLRVNSMLYLFDHITAQNAHKVYLCIGQGTARPQGEIARISVVSSPESELDLHTETRGILRRYAKLRAEEGVKSEAVRAFLALARYIAKVD